MTKYELLEALKDLPDDAEIEIAVPVEQGGVNMEGKIWLEISRVEDTNPDLRDDNTHCLLFACRITME